MSLNGVKLKVTIKKGLMAYQARLKSPTKLGTQHIVDKLLQSDKDISLELKDTREKWEFYERNLYRPCTR